MIVPRVTVYLANHNYGRYIARAIESVLAQTMSDFELIVIDDGSTDDSRAVIARYAGDPRVRTIFQHNQGLAVTNNIALRAARGGYVMRLDADDWLDSHALAVLASALDHDPELGLVFPDYYLVDADGAVVELVRRQDLGEADLLDRPAHGACTMARRSLLLEIGGYDESFRCQDGWDIWIRLVHRNKVRNVNLPLFYYRRHPRSLTRDEAGVLKTRAEILARHAQARGRARHAAAIVPVRGSGMDPGSIALEHLGGLRVIDWTLEPALAAERVLSVAVSSPDPELLAHVERRYRGRVIALARAQDLARLNTPIEDTVFDALARLETAAPRHEAVAVLYVECPFRTARQIDTGLDMLDLFDTDVVVGVRPETDIFYQHDGSGLVPIRNTNGLRLEREEIYRSAGKLYLARRSALERSRKLVSGRMGHFVIDAHSAIQLTSDWEFDIARYWAGRLAVSADRHSRTDRTLADIEASP
jgi:CMP-N-acetylneuraminic acid synthetase